MAKCLNCGSEFEAKRSTAKYCSHTCRAAAFRARGGKSKFVDELGKQKVQRPRKLRSGYVYIIQSGNSHCYKIGSTVNRPMARLRELQVGSAAELTLYEVIYCKDVRAAEAQAHKCVAEYRGRGEWFELEDYILEQLVEMLIDEPVQEYMNDMDWYYARNKGQKATISPISGYCMS